MKRRFSGRQTQFYIDLVYGVAFAIGFVYLLYVPGLNVGVVAFMGGLILGYFLRVWENMTVYERILEEEVAEQVAQEAEQQVPDEVEEQVSSEVQQQVPAEVEEQVSTEVEEQVPDEVQQQVEAEAEERVEEELESRMVADADEDTADQLAEELIERLAEVHEGLPEELRKQLEERQRGG